MKAVTLFQLLVCIAAASLMSSMPSEARSDRLVLMPGQHHRIIGQHIRYMRDPTGRLTAVDLMAEEAKSFRKLPGEKIDLGFTHDMIWLKLPVTNGADRTGQWILATNVNFMNRLEAWLVRDGRAEIIVTESERTPFSARPDPYRHVTGRFSLAPGERASILIGYRSGGSSSMPLSIETAESFFDRRAYEAVKNMAFYAAMAVMVFFTLVLMPAFRSRVQLAFAAYLTWVVLYVAHMDGYTLQFLWPELPRWNAFASLPLGYGNAIFAAVFAREFLGTRKEDRRLDLVIQGIIWVTLAVILSGLFVDTQLLKKLGFPYVGLSTLVLLGCSIASLRYNRPGVPFFIAGWLGIIASALYSTFAHWKPGALPVDASFDTIHLGLLFQGIMFALAMARQLRSFRRERDSALRREMRALEENVALERSHAYAQALADARRSQLASASHDLKQPLLSLKLMLRRAIGPQDSAALTSMQRSIDYLEKLVRRYLDDSLSVTLDGDAEDAEAGNRFDAALILDNVTAMFADEAQTNGGSLRLVRTSARVCGDPMAVMRIVSNFVSNSVKHSKGGDVLIGCRRRKGALRIEVHNQGPLLGSDRLKRLHAAYESGRPLETRPDEGLGLKIALQLIVENGYGFDVTSSRQHRTVFALILPLA